MRNTFQPWRVERHVVFMMLMFTVLALLLVLLSARALGA